MKNKFLLVTTFATSMLLLQACCNGRKRNCFDCGREYVPVPVYVWPEENNGNNVVIVGDHNVVNQNQVNNNTKVTNSGSGSVNVSNNTNTTSNNHNRGNQNTTQNSGSLPVRQNTRDNRKEDKKVEENRDCEECVEHWYGNFTLRATGTITTYEEGGATTQNTSSYNRTVSIGGNSR